MSSKKPTTAQQEELIAAHFHEIMEILGLDVNNDESLSGTPGRVARMYVRELFKGLRGDTMPVITTFPNDEGYETMLIEKNIRLVSVCEHHFVPIIGKCHIAYIPGDRVLGLSKFHRIVDWFSSKPQLQERLTQEIGSHLEKVLETEDVAVIIDAVHHCCGIRGVRDINSSTVTSFIKGRFLEPVVRTELLDLIKM
jgi:GTP cyclohydrolase I